jgi:NDP-sugar pyrophosphorylase family protein
VIGPGAKIGDGARLRDAVVLAGAELAPRSIVFGGVFATDAT